MPRDLPVGNGTVLVNFDSDYNLRDIYFPFVGKENQTVGHVNRFGVWVDGQFSWVGSDWKMQRKYVAETLVTDVLLTNDKLGLELTVHDAVEFFLYVFLRQVTVRDLRGEDRKVRLFFHHDFHIYENEVGDTAFYDPRTQSVIHYKGSRYFLINGGDDNKSALDQWAVGQKEMQGAEGTWRDAEDGTLSGNAIAQGSVDSTVGLNLDVPASGSTSVHYWICFGFAYEKVVKLNRIVSERSPGKLLQRTENYWKLWVNKEQLDFQDLPDKVVNLYKQSLLIIRTQIDDHGAIIAANDQDIAQFARDTYSYMWPRDGSLVTYALVKAGYREVGHAFFKFCLDLIGEDGYFLHKYNPDKTLASSWHPWVRDGKSDLPIQEDETALVLWVLWEYFAKFRDVEFIRPLYRRLISNAGDFMVQHRDPETHLPLPSYDLWEERHGVHLFTVGAVVGGLQAAANFAHAFGEFEQEQTYQVALNEIKAGMTKYLWNGKAKRFCRMATRTSTGYDLDMTLDASMYGVFAFGALPVDDPMVTQTLTAIRERLWVKTSVGGLARYENDYYQQVSKDIENVPGNPWFVCTLWLAQYYIAAAKTLADLDRALELLVWVSDHALPSGVLAEQVDPYCDAPLSVSPLTWSHASFVMCVVEYLEMRTRLLDKHSARDK
ncbi:MAG: glycoside hydrolase family 15 protein [Cyanobacteria bacterium SZAS-4]|nr:glycoside hydrolase family 15 protein [Cyanobacteria bacterium SZAS-4]